MPDLYFKDYTDIYEVVGIMVIDMEYDVKNYAGEGYLFKPSFTSGWKMNYMIERQLESENIKPKPSKTLNLKQLTKKAKHWNLW